ncbi:MAG TPA: sulfatase-like hydrolase/transferase [Opitutus sp.]|nr:sulfatase-like hydrolase/transferase [Opitutus sp.]
MAERKRASNEQPFFLYLALAGPHTPVVPTPEFEGKSRTTAYGDFVTQIDADVGRILAALEQSGLAENTIVVFTSDNGFAPPGGLEALRQLGHDPSGGLRGFKSDLFEGGHRVPFIVRWPAAKRAGVKSSALIGQLDLFATCAEILGVGLPTDAAEDSVSFLSELRGNAPVVDGPRTSLVHHSSEGRFSIREGRWKLLLWPGSGGWSAPTPAPSRWLKNEVADLSLLPAFQLYDLTADPTEQTNVASAFPEIVQRLGRLMSATIKNGRSTAGISPAVNPGADWPQTAWLEAFAP